MAKDAPGTAEKAVDTALVIAATTAVAYAVAYSYEAGYCSHFGIPAYLIVPTTSVLVAAVVGVAFSALNVMPLVAMFRQQLHKRGVSELARFRFEMAILFIFVIFAVGGLHWLAFTLSLVTVLVFCGEYISVFFIRGTLADRFAMIDKIPDPVAEHHPLGRLLSAVNDRRVVRFVFAGLAAYVAALGIGAFNARTQTEFQVVLSRPDVALVKSYGDLLVGVKFDEKAKQFTGEIVVFKVSDDFKELRLLRKRVGPLVRRPD